MYTFSKHVLYIYQYIICIHIFIIKNQDGFIVKVIRQIYVLVPIYLTTDITSYYKYFLKFQ